MSYGSSPALLSGFLFVGTATITGYFLDSNGNAIGEIDHDSTTTYTSLTVPEGAVGMRIKASTTCHYVIADPEGNAPFNEAACTTFGDAVPTTPTSFGRVAE